MSYKVLLRRKTNKEESLEKLDTLIETLSHKLLSGGKGNGWRCRKTRLKEPQKEGDQYVYLVPLSFDKTSGHRSAAERQWPSIQSRISKLLLSPRFMGWELLDNDGKNIGGAENVKIEETKNYFDGLNLVPQGNFDHIYDREAQILLVRSAIETAVKTELKKRFNCVLFGPPGCGKTEILLSIGKMLGKEGEAYLKFDATSTTEAGAQRLLLESPNIPPILIVEEIEKTDEKSLRWLLGICDERGEVRKTNFRIGHNAREVKMLVLATVNNMNLFNNLLAGALSSRFPNKIYCDRPDRSVMQQILEREVKSIKGDDAWIEPTLSFCMDKLGWNDPRKLIPVCLQGQHKLLDGTYQQALLKTLPPEERK
jgi:energy-coupling factor transporter ATP-binding protein EcfA2